MQVNKRNIIGNGNLTDTFILRDKSTFNVNANQRVPPRYEPIQNLFATSGDVCT
jgi:hypothetical protein